MSGWLRAFLSMQTRINGGERDTEQNELTVIPMMPPSRRVVRIATPLPQRLMAVLNWSAEMAKVEPPRDGPRPNRNIIPSSPVRESQGHRARRNQRAAGRQGWDGRTGARGR